MCLTGEPHRDTVNAVKLLARLDLPCILQSGVHTPQTGTDSRIDDRISTFSREDVLHLCARAIYLLARALSGIARDLL